MQKTKNILKNNFAIKFPVWYISYVEKMQLLKTRY